MNDEELRAFLESATVGDDDEQQGAAAAETAAEKAAEPTVVLPPGPAEHAAGDRSPSFDELMGWGAPSATAADAGLTPLVLPGPPAETSRSVRQDPAAPPAQTRPEPSPVFAPPKPAASAAPRPAVATPPAPAASAATPTTPIVPIPQTPPVAAAQFGPSTSALPEIGEDYEKISVTGGERGAKRFIPWIIVGAGAVIALIVAVFVIGSLNGGGAGPEPTAAPTTTQGTPSEETPSPSDDPDETRPTPTPTAPSTTVPQVEVGPIMNMPITQWNVQADLSQKLGDTYYNITGENLVLTTSLIDSLPASCSKEWGMTRLADGSFEVLKPAERCAAAPELYDELWGLMHAMVQTVRPL